MSKLVTKFITLPKQVQNQPTILGLFSLLSPLSTSVSPPTQQCLGCPVWGEHVGTFPSARCSLAGFSHPTTGLGGQLVSAGDRSHSPMLYSLLN